MIRLKTLGNFDYLPAPHRQTKPLILDLNSEEGNAFFLIGVARSLAQVKNLDFAQIEREMTAGDYRHLIHVFERYFSDEAFLYCDEQLFNSLNEPPSDSKK